MENLSCASKIIMVIAQSSVLRNTELNDVTLLDSLCSTSKYYGTNINTRRNTNTTDELIKK